MLDGHIDMEAEARGEHKALLDELGIGDDETRQARPPTEFEIAAQESTPPTIAASRATSSSSTATSAS